MKMRRLLRRYASPLVLCILFLAACGTQGVGEEPGSATLSRPIPTYEDRDIGYATTARTVQPIPSSQAYDLDGARQALMAYFSLLHAERYSEATHYYGGSYEILRDWNPTVARDHHATLFQKGCTANGLMCLRIGTIVRQEQVSPTEFRFTVEFMNDDGTLFVRGPCCGATETMVPPQSQFAYTVKKVEDRYLVQDLPVYVP